MDFKKYNMYGDIPLRITLGLIFITTGYSKLFGGLDGFSGMLTGIGFPAPYAFAVVVGVIEFVGAIALFAGFFTRYISAFLAVIIIVALVAVKLPQGWTPAFLDMAVLGGLLSLMLTGSSLGVSKK